MGWRARDAPRTARQKLCEVRADLNCMSMIINLPGFAAQSIVPALGAAKLVANFPQSREGTA